MKTAFAFAFSAPIERPAFAQEAVVLPSLGSVQLKARHHALGQMLHVQG